MFSHKCDSSVCLQRPWAQPAIFSKSPIYKAHSLNSRFSSSLEIAEYKQQMPGQNSSDKGRQLEGCGESSGSCRWPRQLLDFSLSLSETYWPLPCFPCLLPSLTCFSLKASSLCLLRHVAENALRARLAVTRACIQACATHNDTLSLTTDSHNRKSGLSLANQIYLWYKKVRPKWETAEAAALWGPWPILSANSVTGDCCKRRINEPGTQRRPTQLLNKLLPASYLSRAWRHQWSCGPVLGASGHPWLSWFSKTRIMSNIGISGLEKPWELSITSRIRKWCQVYCLSYLFSYTLLIPLVNSHTHATHNHYTGLPKNLLSITNLTPLPLLLIGILFFFYFHLLSLVISSILFSFPSLLALNSRTKFGSINKSHTGHMGISYYIIQWVSICLTLRSKKCLLLYLF